MVSQSRGEFGHRPRLKFELFEERTTGKPALPQPVREVKRPDPAKKRPPDEELEENIELLWSREAKNGRSLRNLHSFVSETMQKVIPQLLLR